jgi:hypothetical protein
MIVDVSGGFLVSSAMPFESRFNTYDMTVSWLEAAL